ncbi:CPBP family intramembrane glutamic endopeptidase [Clostridium felsineum]|uniref:CAAX prenyl protease 2/Lysostaphin resistance protein A-like domain-containing protein n=1 Tax=Clostridium felsineum TaxID=36839 RepID=A0A1S8LDA3_9CLOT|nr:CPBP family intramembrane glutamic endopeptidase [Clostridium felsineum]URZ06120.1 hypothetical protein CLROS_014530 [Clostridium felsineum]URZ11157.1 hypothetical protein CROST_018740 [Clostridium felsineum]
MLDWYNKFVIKFIIILIIVAFTIKFLTKVISFYTYDMNIKKVKRSGILSLIVIVINAAIIIVYVLFTKKYPRYNCGFTLTLVYFFQLLLILAVAILTKEGISSLGITKNNAFKSIVVGGLSGVIFCVAYKNIAIVGSDINIISTTSLYIFIMNAMVGFVEEVIYRGYLQTRLTCWIGTVKGLLITSVLFGLIHIPKYLIWQKVNFDKLLISCLIITVSGTIFGYMRIKTKNIIACSILHTVIDWAQVVMQAVG